VFRRFAASLDRTGSDPGSSVGSHAGQSSILGMSDTRLTGSDTASGASTSPGDTEDQGSVHSGLKDEDIGLAPLEEELESKRDEPPKEPADDTISSASAASDSSLDGPMKSLIEEQLEAGRLGNADTDEQFMHRRPEDIKLLYPPGYVRPRTGVSPWLYVGLGLGGCLLIALVIWLLSL
jgi:hypothetical protein